MTKEVLVTISGSQVIDGEKGNVEMITTGEYYQRNGSHYIIYREMMEGFDEAVHNVIKIRPDCMDIIKTGLTEVHMKFERNKKQLARYAAPMGEMMIGLNTRNISVDENQDSIKVRVEYTLDINYEPISECDIMVDIQSKASAQMHLRS